MTPSGEARAREHLSHAVASLSHAADVVNPVESLRALRDAVTHVAAVMALLHPDTTPAPGCSAWLRSLFERHTHSPESCSTTIATIDKLQRSPEREMTACAESDPLFISAAIPAVADLIDSAQAELRLATPVPVRIRAGSRRLLTGLLGLLLVILLLRWLLPFGLIVTYYRGPDFNCPVALRTHFSTHQDYGKGRPAFGIRSNHWSSRWQGHLLAPNDDAYTFYVQSDDGVRIWIDDELIIDNWSEQNWATSGRSATVDLKGGKHRFRLEHFKRSGLGNVRVRWSGGGIPPNTVLAHPYLFKY